MGIADIATLVTSVVALAGGALALYKLSRIEQPHSDADLAGKFLKMANECAEKMSTLRHDLSELDNKVGQLENNWADAEAHIVALDQYIDELIMLMKSHGMQPLRAKPVRRQRPTAGVL